MYFSCVKWSIAVFFAKGKTGFAVGYPFARPFSLFNSAGRVVTIGPFCYYKFF
jgi:hypothetical protein